MSVTSLGSKFGRLLGDTKGNFAMIGAVAVPLVFAAASFGVDTTNAFSMKSHLQEAADAAALATSSYAIQDEDMTEQKAKAFALKFIQGQLGEYTPIFANLSVTPNVTVKPVKEADRTVWKVSVELYGSQTTTRMASFLGKEKIDVAVGGASESARGTQGAMSMSLVLDESGSMGWYLGGIKKMDALKAAVNDLMAQFDESDPDERYVRVGVTTYASSHKGNREPDWNHKNVKDYVSKLNSRGGTDSTDAFKVAYKQVTSDKEKGAHKGKNGRDPKKFILFMTDGANNYSSSDYNTLTLCARAKKNGVEVFTVAFAAPARGRALLSKCASSADHYFDAKNSAELIKAFEEIGRKTADSMTRLTG